MSKSIDVLAVMDRLASASCDPDGGTEFADIEAHAARAAVAELIEADIELDAAFADEEKVTAQWRRLQFVSGAEIEILNAAGHRVSQAKLRRSAALNRVRGAE